MYIIIEADNSRISSTMSKRALDEVESSVVEEKVLKKKQKLDKQGKEKDKKSKRSKRDKSEDSKNLKEKRKDKYGVNSKNADGQNLEKIEPAIIKQIAISDLMSVEHSVCVIQENLKKLMQLAPNLRDLEQYTNFLIAQSTKSGMGTNGDITAKILLLSKSHKIQLASQLKTLSENGQLPIVKQIIDFDNDTVLENVSDVQLKLKEKNRELHRGGTSSEAFNSLLPPLPTIDDSVLEAKVFVHKSATNNELLSSKQDTVQSNNERLEFLGDAVLETVISDVIEYRYRGFDEGQLSSLRSTLVKNETIELLSRAYKFPERQMELLDSHMVKTELTEFKVGKNKRIADLFEAYIGALFIDKGRNGPAYDFIKDWLSKVYSPILKEFDGFDHLKYLHVSSKLRNQLLSETPETVACKADQNKSKHIQFDTLDSEEDKVSEVESTSSATVLEKELKFPITFTSSEPVNKLAKGELYALIGSAKLHPIYKNEKSQNDSKHYLTTCSIAEDILGYGEGRNLKDSSARAAQAALLNKPMIEKYHLLRMMTPRSETRASQKLEFVEKPEVASSTTLKQYTPKFLKTVQYIGKDEIPTPNSSSKNKLVDLLAKKGVVPRYHVEEDKENKSILPMFRTTLKVNDIDVAYCIDASKKKGLNKVSQWLLEKIEEVGEKTIYHDLKLE